MRKVLIPILIFASGILVGLASFALILAPDSSQRDTNIRKQAKSDRDATPGSELVVGSSEVILDTAKLVTRLLELSEIQDAFQANYELYAMLRSTGKDELVALLRQSDEIEHVGRREQVQIAIVRKLASQDPSEALRQVQALPDSDWTSMIYELFQEWSVSNLDGAVAGAATLTRLQRDTALKAILETRSKLPPTEFRRIGRRLGNEILALRLSAAIETSELMAQPQQAWNLILNDETNDALQSDLLIEVVEAWKNQDGLAIITYILEANLADTELQDSLVRAVVESDPQSAFVYVQEFPATERAELTKVIASCWARSDPKSALEVISSVEPPSLREILQDVVVETWAKFDPLAVIEDIEDFGTSQRASVVRHALRELALLSPYEAIKRLNEVQKYVGEDANIHASIVEAWSRHDPSGAVDWILTAHNQDKIHQRNLLDWVLPRLVAENPNKAFAIAQEHSDEIDSELEVVVIRALTDSGQTEIAKEILPRLRKSSRPIGYALVGISKVKNNEPGEVLHLAEDLQGSERGLYYADVFDGWAKFNGVQLFEQLQSFQSVHTRSLAASTLIRYNQLNPVLSESQIESARQHLTDSDRARLERSINRNR